MLAPSRALTRERPLSLTRAEQQALDDLSCRVQVCSGNMTQEVRPFTGQLLKACLLAPGPLIETVGRVAIC